MLIQIKILNGNTAVLHDAEANTRRRVHVPRHDPALLMDHIEAELKGHAFNDWEDARRLDKKCVR